MAGLKYSKQRASIKDYLMHTTSHPTADIFILKKNFLISASEPYTAT